MTQFASLMDHGIDTHPYNQTPRVLCGAAGWVLAEMRAAEADKTEGELAGVVRRLKLDQQGAQLDCAICLRRVRPATLRSTSCSVGFVISGRDTRAQS